MTWCNTGNRSPLETVRPVFDADALRIAGRIMGIWGIEIKTSSMSKFPLVITNLARSKNFKGC